MEISGEYIDSSARYDQSAHKSNTKPAETLSQSIPESDAQTGGHPDAVVSMPENIAVDLLKSFGLKQTESNLKMVELLLKSNLALDKNNLMQLSRALCIFGAENPDKALFLLENKIPVSIKNANTLIDLAEGAKLTVLLESLAESVELLSPEVKEAVMNALLSGGDNNIGTGNNSGSQLTTSNDGAVNNELKNSTESLPVIMTEHAESLEQISDDNLKQTTSFAEETAPNDVNAEALANDNLVNGDLINDDIVNNEQKNNELKNQELKNEVINTTDGIINEKEEASKFIEKSGSIIKRLSGGVSLSENEITELILRQDNQLKRTDKRDNIFNKLMSRFKLNPEKNSSHDLEKLINELNHNVNNAKSIIEKSDLKDEKIIKELTNISRRLEFAGELKNAFYVQIPVTLENKSATAEIYVFGDKKKIKSKAGTASALISIDTANIGRFEAFVEKNGRDISCRFQLETSEFDNAVRDNIGKLETLLSAYDYRLVSYVFAPQVKPFSLLDISTIISEAEIRRATVDVHA